MVETYKVTCIKIRTYGLTENELRFEILSGGPGRDHISLSIEFPPDKNSDAMILLYGVPSKVHYEWPNLNPFPELN